ncbi:hypothetical protein Acr_14g0002860 [Actinidia rufa]|uniref:Uncharacterized protein n=1 Tax=Actinidia rufa TaxID=165716 RepID=A0A7J0FPS9_9ERIC|nr:hypothetical protein Acr_14g0002860 [Actinidia rufa]
MDTAHYSVYKKAAPPLNKGTQAEHTLHLSSGLFYPVIALGLITTPEEFLSGLAPALHFFWRRLWERQFSMHLRSRNLPRPSASSPLDNRAPLMANARQVPDLEGLHHEIHGMAEQMRVMNENNARLIQLLAAANPQPPAAPSVPDVSSDLATLIVRGIVLTTSVPNEQGIGTEHQVRPYVKGVPLLNLVKRDPELDATNTGTNAPITVDALVRQTDPPFTERVLRTRISSKFKLPTQLGIYEGKTDPMDHLDSYKSLMSLQETDKRMLPTCSPFTKKETEGLKDFVKRFNQAVLDVEDPSDKVIIMAMMEGLRPGPLFDSLSKNVPETLSALQSKADKYIAAEELAEAKRRRRGKEDHKRKEPDTRRADYREEMRYKRPDRDSKRSNNRRPRTPPRRPEFNLPPLNTPVAQVLSEIKHKEFIKWPGKIKTDPQKRNRNKYCEFHRDHGHNTEDCFQLKEQIADLIKRGYLRKYITDRHRPIPQKGNTVTTDQLRKIYKRSMEASDQVDVRLHPGRGMLGVPLGRSKKRFYNLSSPCVSDQPPITFSSDDLRGLHLPHDDALVVSAVIANFNVQRILIDSGSSADILFISAFEKMKIRLDKLHPFHTPLIGFGGNTTHPLGWINLPITLGTEPQQTTVWQDFIVVDCPSPYNSILGRPTLGRIKAITSTYHLKMKFPTLTGIGEVKGDQKVARQCFISAMKVGTSVQSTQ